MSSSKMLMGILCWVVLLCLSANAQNRWASLNGPYWVNGVDVAIGQGGALDQAWHRYLIGHNSGVNLYYWWENGSSWQLWDQRPYANKLISYKTQEQGHFAICSAYENDIYVTDHGGDSWSPMGFDGDNKQFTSIECINWTDNPGQEVFVTSQHVPGYASAYFTTDAGQNWSKLGGTSDPLDNLDVYDIETLPAVGENAFLTAATSAGIYRHNGDYGTSWEYKAFGDGQVHVIESLDYWDNQQQVAAVTFAGGDRRLYYTATGWDSWREIFLQGDLHFDKEVRDMSAIYWGDSCISCYVASDEGLFRAAYSDPSKAKLTDLATLCPAMSDDSGFTCVDYIFMSGVQIDSAFVLAGSHHSVYEITEVRDNKKHSMISIDAKEAVEGTYYIGPDDGEPVKAGQ